MRRKLSGTVRAVHGGQDRELVAADSRDVVVGAERGGQPVGETPQRVVSGRETLVSVEVLERVHVRDA